MSLTIKRNYEGIKNLRTKCNLLNNSTIDTGFFEDKVYDGSGTGPGRGVREPGHNAGVQVAEIALINNDGSFDVPPRPFIETFVNNQIKKQKQKLGLGIANALTKNVPIALGFIGKRFKQELKEVIEYWSFHDHNSPTTIELKGFDDTLEDTGVMLEAVDYRVKGKNK